LLKITKLTLSPGFNVDVSNKITWWKTGNATWETKQNQRGYTGEITIGAKPSPYQLQINPGALVSQHETLGIAKSHFRKFLFDKPV